MKRIGSTVLLVVLNLCCAGASSREFEFKNPVSRVAIRDPQITKVGHAWFMTATSPPFFPPQGSMDNPGARIWSSVDLKNWKLVTVAVRPSASHWYKRLFWAPELFPYRGKWYLTFNCPDGMSDGPQMVGLAVAERIVGPYKVITEKRPLSHGNDATLFEDDDGEVYMFHSGDTFTDGIYAVQVDLNRGMTVGPQLHILSPASSDLAAWDGPSRKGSGVGIEGPTVLKRGNTYYMLYASWGRGYEEGYATAGSISGPWTKFPENPIYGAQDLKRCRENGRSCTQSSNVPFREVGHGSPFIGPDGKLWFGCHGIRKGNKEEPHLVITPMQIDAEGVIHMQLTWTTQRTKVSGTFAIQLNSVRLASPELTSLAEVQ